MPIRIPEIWLNFLRDVDTGLSRPVVVHCIGGFVLVAMWNHSRPTADVDFIEISPSEASQELLNLAGSESELAKKHRFYFQRVSIAPCPLEYESRLTDITPQSLKRLHLLALEIHDLVLAKIDRFSPRDREDIGFLARQGALDLSLLRRRFEQEMTSQVLNEAGYLQKLDICVEELSKISPR